MSSNVRKCDICGDVFEIRYMGCHYFTQYNSLELPHPGSLESVIKYVTNDKARQGIRTTECDVCADCLIAICEAMLARREPEG